jgi:hypothetical protein
LSVIAQSGWVCVCFQLVVDFDDIVGQFDKSSLDPVYLIKAWDEMGDLQGEVQVLVWVGAILVRR